MTPTSRPMRRRAAGDGLPRRHHRRAAPRTSRGHPRHNLVPNDDCGSASPPARGAPRPRPARGRVRLLLLPVGARLDAVAVRSGEDDPTQPARSASRRSSQGYARRRDPVQMLARLTTVAPRRLTLKADLDDDRRRRLVGPRLRRRQWNEREHHESSASASTAIPTCATFYLPTRFEGYRCARTCAPPLADCEHPGRESWTSSQCLLSRRRSG